MALHNGIKNAEALFNEQMKAVRAMITTQDGLFQKYVGQQ
jgi:hypothetical protein